MKTSEYEEQSKKEELKDFETIEAKFETFEFPPLSEQSDSEKMKYWRDKFRDEITSLKGNTTVKI